VGGPPSTAEHIYALARDAAIADQAHALAKYQGSSTTHGANRGAEKTSAPGNERLVAKASDGEGGGRSNQQPRSTKGPRNLARAPTYRVIPIPNTTRGIPRSIKRPPPGTPRHGSHTAHPAYERERAPTAAPTHTQTQQQRSWPPSPGR
jgi:hypothetical protein